VCASLVSFSRPSSNGTRMPPITRLCTYCHSTFFGLLVSIRSLVYLSLCNASYVHIAPTSCSLPPPLPFPSYNSKLKSTSAHSSYPFPSSPPCANIALSNYRVVSLPRFFPPIFFPCFQSSIAFRREWLGTRILPMNPSRRAPVIGSVSWRINHASMYFRS